MGEWFEYFEDFPEENPGNYVNGQFDPAGAEARRKQREKLRSDVKGPFDPAGIEARQREKLSAEQDRLDAEIKAVIESHRQGKS